MLAIDFLNYFIVNKYAPDTTGTFVYFSQTDGGYGRYGVGMTFILGLLFAAKFVVPGLIFKIVTKIPNKVVFANSKGYEKMRGTAVVIMMVIIVVGRVGQYILSLLFSTVHLDGIYSIFVFSEDPVVALVSFAFFAIICSYNARDSISRSFFADFSSIWRHLRYYDHCCCERFMLL